MKRQRVWDLPTRLFHWLLAVSIVAAVVTGKIGGNMIDWHGRIGLFIVGLVTFRVVWGFIGSTSARFASFVRGPRTIKAYLRGEWRGVGHNPLGALSVLGLLAFIAAQVVTGLFANDDIAFQGPLANLVGVELSNRLRSLHGLLQYVLIALAVLHLAAIIFYVRFKRENLLKPMITGWKEVPAEPAQEEPAQNETLQDAQLANRGRITRGGAIAFVLASAIAATTVYAAAGGLLRTPPPPPPASATPGW